MVHQIAAERAVLLAGSRQHGDEAATVSVDVLHVGFGGELGIRDVAKVATPEQSTQAVLTGPR